MIRQCRRAARPPGGRGRRIKIRPTSMASPTSRSARSSSGSTAGPTVCERARQRRIRSRAREGASIELAPPPAVRSAALSSTPTNRCGLSASELPLLRLRRIVERVASRHRPDERTRDVPCAASSRIAVPHPVACSPPRRASRRRSCGGRSIDWTHAPRAPLIAPCHGAGAPPFRFDPFHELSSRLFRIRCR